MRALRPASLVVVTVLTTLLSPLGAGAPATGAAPEAAPDGAAATTFTAFRDLAVDDEHGHVFVTHGTSSVSVLDLDGEPVTSLTGMPGSSGLVLSDDGETLYVALAAGDAVAAVDTATLASTTLPTGTGSCPTHLATTAGLVWFSGACDTNARAGALDPVTGDVDHDLLGWGPFVLAASPALPNTLLTITPGISPTTLSKYVVTAGAGGPTVELAASTQVGSNGKDLAISPNGSRVATASGSPYEHPVFRTSDLAADGHYDAEPYPTAVAFRPDGMFAGGINGIYSADVFVSERTSRDLFRSYDFESSNRTVLDRGLAFGEERLYVVEGGFDVSPRLHVITPRLASELTVRTDRSRYSYGDRATVTVELADGAGETVTVYAASPGRDRQLLQAVTVRSDGAVTLRVPVRRRTTFSATYAGDDLHDPARASAPAVVVRARVTGVLTRYDRISNGYRLYSVGSRIWYAVAVSPNHAGDCVRSRVQFKVGGRWGHDATTRCLRLSSTSKARAYLDGGRDYLGIPMRFRAEWAGDKENAASTSGWSLARYVR